MTRASRVCWGPVAARRGRRGGERRLRNWGRSEAVFLGRRLLLAGPGRPPGAADRGGQQGGCPAGGRRRRRQHAVTLPCHVTCSTRPWPPHSRHRVVGRQDVPEQGAGGAPGAGAPADAARRGHPAAILAPAPPAFARSAAHPPLSPPFSPPSLQVLDTSLSSQAAENCGEGGIHSAGKARGFCRMRRPAAASRRVRLARRACPPYLANLPCPPSYPMIGYCLTFSMQAEVDPAMLASSKVRPAPSCRLNLGARCAC